MRFLLIVAFFACFMNRVVYADQMVERVGDWLIMKTEKQSGIPQHCYIVSEPFRTKAYFGIKARLPRFAVVYLDKDEYTIQVNTDYDTAGNSTFININRISRMLESSMIEGVSHTYSSVQDVAIIDDLIRESGYFTVVVKNESGANMLDYYSLFGFGKAIREMTRICKHK